MDSRPSISEGDRVETHEGRIGTVTYISTTGYAAAINFDAGGAGAYPVAELELIEQ